MDKIRIRIGFFVGIALIWSLIWVSQKSLLNNFFETIPQITILLFGLVPTLGLLIGSFILRKKMDNPNNSLTGGKPFYSLIVVSIPILCLSIIGIKNIFGIQENLFGIIIAASAGIGEISKSTKSILICAAVHGIANILFIYGMISNNLSTPNKITILFACLAVWIPIIIKIERENIATNMS